MKKIGTKFNKYITFLNFNRNSQKIQKNYFNMVSMGTIPYRIPNWPSKLGRNLLKYRKNGETSNVPMD
ncbi:hypothetical protein BpHYR1_049648 [Brachionus plicatilis]|uniref:Uncharacterized protein n=1 Tax=Brachionus plicatilis TaxID=10195 RepID=A0A3M7R683_BRAPC|nr:hypothetical protein BpHYR1_049648 [Brachionus plicatilis]